MIILRFVSHASHQEARSMEPMVEMCAGSSCMEDLLVQLAIILGYKELVQNTVKKIGMPYVCRLKDALLQILYYFRHDSAHPVYFCYFFLKTLPNLLFNLKYYVRILFIWFYD